MGRNLIAIVGLVVVVAVVMGCGRGSARSAVGTSQPATAVDESRSKERKPAEAAAVVAADSPATSDDAPAPDETASSAGADLPPAAPAADDPQFRERIAVLTPGGPLLVDVWLTLDSRPHKEAFDARIKQVLVAGDADGDGESAWNDFAANEEFLQAQRAAMPDSARRRSEAWTERFDLNRDKVIQPEEAAAWLGRAAGRSAAPLVLRSRRSYHAIPSLSSRVWQLLDGNKSGRLDADEISGASEMLLSLDANDDRVITSPELAPLREQLDDPRMQTSYIGQTHSRHAALYLEPHSDIDRLDYLLGDLYAPLQALDPTSFPILPRLFEELDANGDDRLEHEELAKLLTVEPHVALAVEFGKADVGGRGEVRLQVRSHAPEIYRVVQPSASRALLSLGDIRVLVSAHDLALSESAEPSGELSEIRAMVHDECDALFEELDGNADGWLGEREITTCPQRMFERDANHDGELANDELPNAMVVAFLRSERPVEQSFYLPETVVTPRERSDGPAWFAHADFNGDGDVSRREFLGSIAQFARLDTNQDAYIDVAEATASEKP